ncbi:MAG: hypothetical protein ACJA0Y_000656, partial [Maricaulis maris]
GLCTQIDLDEQVKKASARRRKLEEENPELLTDTLKAQEDLHQSEEKPAEEAEIDLETLFGGPKAE